MKTKVYLNDWFFNAGVMGFLRILQHNDDNFADVNENYIEFDTENLKNFEKYYFQYFYDRYDVSKNVINRTKNAFEYLENNIETQSEDKDEQKQIKDKIKSNKKYIKDTVKRQLDKIKKIDEQIYNEMKEAYDKIDKEETTVGIEQIKEILLCDSLRENISK